MPAIGIVISDHQDSEPCMTRHISTTGLFALTRRRWPLGTPLSVQVVHAGRRFSLQATVAHCAANGVGLGFGELSPTCRQQLGGLLHTLVPDEQQRVVLPNLHVYWLQEMHTGLFAAWKSRRRKAQLIDITLEGAGLKSKERPEVGQEVMFFLPSLHPESDDGHVQASATVVRHMDVGFALKFQAPPRPFRQTVSELRKELRAG